MSKDKQNHRPITGRVVGDESGMTDHTFVTIDWIERPVGSLREPELEQLAARILDQAYTARTILIDWREVTHVDFRGLSRLASRLRSLRCRGVAVLSDGFDTYLLTILRFSLSEEDSDLFAQGVGGFGRPSTEARAARTADGVPDLSALGISKN